MSKSSGYSLEINGFESLRDNLNALSTSIPDSVALKGIIAGTIEIEGAAKGYIDGGPIDEFQASALAENGTTLLGANSLRRPTGDLVSRITHDIGEDENGNIMGTVGANRVDARIHEIGGVIVPTQAKALRFKVNGQWVTTQKVTMPAQPFLLPGLLVSIEKIKQLFTAIFWQEAGDETKK